MQLAVRDIGQLTDLWVVTTTSESAQVLLHERAGERAVPETSTVQDLCPVSGRAATLSVEVKNHTVLTREAQMREISVPACYVVAPDDNITDDIFEHARNAPDTVGFRRHVNGTWVPVTWREFAEQVRGLAAGLIGAGIRPGDRVGLMSRTRFEWSLLDYAILTAGGVTVPVYPTSSLEQ